MSDQPNESTPKSTDTSSPKQNKLDLPVALRVGGELELRLNTLTSAVSAKQNGDVVHRSVLAGVKEFRRAFENDKPFHHLLVSQVSDREPDCVLAYCVAHNVGIVEETDRLSSKAMEMYLRCPDAYDLLLDDFIPDVFRAYARKRFSVQAYVAGTNLTALEDWDAYCDYLPKRRRQELHGLSTGLPTLDRAIGGLRGLTFLGGGAGVGKTSLAISLVLSALRKHPDLGVIIYSLDMPRTVIYDRIACHETGLDYATYLTGPIAAPTLKIMSEADVKLRQEILPRMRIVERVPWKPKEISVVRAMTDAARDLFANTGVKKLLTVIDYFQLLPVEEEAGSPVDGDFLRVGLLQKLQEATRIGDNPMGDPFLIISEVRKGEMGRTELGIADLMGSSRLGYAAEAILLMEQGRMTETEDKVPVVLRVAKGRDGTVRAEIPLIFEHTRSRISEAPPIWAGKKGAKSMKAATTKKATGGAVDPFAGKKG